MTIPPGSMSSRRAVLAGLAAAPFGAAFGLARGADAATPAPAPMPLALTMATGAPGGGLAAVAPRLGGLAARVGRLAIAYRASGGSVANILLVERRSVQLAIAGLPVMTQAWNGAGAWTQGIALRDFRALFPLFGMSLQVVTRPGSSVSSAATLSGRRIGVGPQGSAGPVVVPRLLAAAGATPRLLVMGGYADQLAALRAGRLDACAFFGATPLPAIEADAAQESPSLRRIGFDPAAIARMRRAVAGLGTVTLPDEMGPAGRIVTVGSVAVALCHAGMPNALGAHLTELAMTHRADLLGALPDAMPAPDAWLGSDVAIGIQPGAAAVLRQHGFGVPARMVQG